MGLRAVASGGEERGVRARELVADVDDLDALRARVGDDAGGVVDGRFDADQGELAGREVVVLEVDDEDCALAHGFRLWFGMDPSCCCRRRWNSGPKDNIRYNRAIAPGEPPCLPPASPASPFTP